jgi:phosphoribosylformylglycinamidine cyclo-ligase
MESSGLHTNGFSLARRIVNERMKLSLHDRFPGADATVADVMLSIHRSYLSVLRPMLPRVHAMAHITGGGLPGNLNRALPKTLDAVVDTTSWNVPNLFVQLQVAGGVDRQEMFRTFNMGVGMTVIAPESEAAGVISAVEAHGVHAWQLGVVRRGSGQVVLN